MARELVLVPKEEYDSLLLSSKQTQEKLSDSNEKFEIKPDDQQNSKETQTPEKQENMDNVQQIKQRGSGKKRKRYVQQSLDKFFQEPSNNTLTTNISKKRPNTHPAMNKTNQFRSKTQKWLTYK